MRLNRFIASGTGVSRRQADKLIKSGRVSVNDQKAALGIDIADSDQVKVGGQVIKPSGAFTYLLLHKPKGYVCSRNGQGNPTIYELLLPQFHSLKPAGRLDKDSTGLMLLTDDGQLIYDLTHPKTQKIKIYQVQLDKKLEQNDYASITSGGVTLSDGVSKLAIEQLPDGWYKVVMYEGRNRQIRRTFEALEYQVVKLHRTQIGSYKIDTIAPGNYKLINKL